IFSRDWSSDVCSSDLNFRSFFDCIPLCLLLPNVFCSIHNQLVMKPGSSLAHFKFSDLFSDSFYHPEFSFWVKKEIRGRLSASTRSEERRVGKEGRFR